MEELAVFGRSEEVADRVWEAVREWRALPQETIGKQLIRSADSVGANLVEGDGRFSKADALNFFVIARGSARETSLWIRRAHKRKLLTTQESTELQRLLTEGTQMLNNLINYRRSTNFVPNKPSLLPNTQTPNTQHLTPNTQHPNPMTTYRQAVDELETILRALETDAVDVDDLTARVERSAELIRLCRQKLRHAEASLDRVFDNLDEDDEPDDDLEVEPEDEPDDDDEPAEDDEPDDDEHDLPGDPGRRW